MKCRTVRLLSYALATAGSFSGMWACGAATSVGLAEVGDEFGTSREGGQDARQPGYDGETPPSDGGRYDGRGDGYPDDGSPPPFDARSDGWPPPFDGPSDSRPPPPFDGPDALPPFDTSHPFDAHDGAPPFDVMPPRDSGTTVTIATDQSPQALVLDDTYVYWENATGSVVNCPLSGCPILDAPSILALNGSAASNLEELAVGDSFAYFVDTSGNVDTCASGGCAGSPSLFWAANDKRHVLLTDPTNVYVVRGKAGGVWLSPLSSLSKGEVAFSASGGAYVLAATSTELYWADDGGSTQSVLARITTGCTLLSCTSPPVRTVCASATLLSAVEAMVVAGGYVYFTTSADPTSIYQCPSSGGGSPSVYATDVAPYALAADGANLYWTNYVASGTVARCPLGAACSFSTTIASKQDQPLAIAANATSAYWTTATAVYEAPK
jgi:hypothetical protein